MKSFVFPLEKVKLIRERELDILTTEWMLVKRAVELKEEELETVDTYMNQLLEQKKSQMLVAISGLELKRFTVKQETLSWQRREVVKELDELYRKLSLAQSKRNLKKQEVSGLTKLREKKQSEHDALARKYEEETIESQWLMKLQQR